MEKNSFRSYDAAVRQVAQLYEALLRLHARRIRQHGLRGQVDRRRLAWQPLIDAGIGRAHFLVADVEAAADRRERVLVAREQHLRLADELLARRERDRARVERREARPPPGVGVP